MSAHTFDPDAVTIGVDYGTLSGRAVVVRVRDGEELGSAVLDYPHGVLDHALPSTLAGTDVDSGPTGPSRCLPTTSRCCAPPCRPPWRTPGSTRAR